MMLVEFCHDGQSPEICNDSWQMGREHLRLPVGYQGSSRLTIDGLEVFSFIPDNVLSESSAYLPTSRVHNVQLVSRKMASVEFSPEYCWSRFNFPKGTLPYPVAADLTGREQDQRPRTGLGVSLLQVAASGWR